MSAFATCNHHSLTIEIINHISTNVYGPGNRKSHLKVAGVTSLKKNNPLNTPGKAINNHSLPVFSNKTDPTILQTKQPTNITHTKLTSLSINKNTNIAIYHQSSRYLSYFWYQSLLTPFRANKSPSTPSKNVLTTKATNTFTHNSPAAT